MESIILQILAAAYASVGILNAIAYWPTIKDLYYHKKPSANISSYVLWTMTTGISSLYGAFILQDPLFRVVAGAGFVSCLTVLILSLNLKYKERIKNINLLSFLLQRVRIK